MVSDEFYLGSVILALILGALCASLARYLTVTRPERRLVAAANRYEAIRQRTIRESADKLGIDPAEIEGYDPDWVDPEEVPDPDLPYPYGDAPNRASTQ